MKQKVLPVEEKEKKIKKNKLIGRQKWRDGQKERDKYTGEVERRKKKEENERLILDIFNGIAIKKRMNESREGI